MECSIQGVTYTAGELGSLEESRNLMLSCGEDIVALTLNKGTEAVLIQLLSLEQKLNQTLAKMEARIQEVERCVRLLMNGNGAEDGDVGPAEGDGVCTGPDS